MQKNSGWIGGWVEGWKKKPFKELLTAIKNGVMLKFSFSAQQISDLGFYSVSTTTPIRDHS